MSTDHSVFRLMICYARSGGTLLNRCLGSLPGVLMLSEVNPQRRESPDNPLKAVQAQARDWYGYALKSGTYAEGVMELARKCEEDGRSLLIRDWSVIDFVPMKENDFKPSRSFSNLQCLKALGDVRPFAFVRDPIDVWISNGSHREFFGGYRRYAEALSELDVPIFKYEDFCQDTAVLLKEICQCLGISYSDHWREFSGYQRVTGDVRTQKHTSRGLAEKDIRKFPRRRIPRANIEWVNACEDMQVASRLTGYAPRYEGRPRESWLGLSLKAIRRIVERGDD
jgi:hypothetical protein